MSRFPIPFYLQHPAFVFFFFSAFCSFGVLLFWRFAFFQRLGSDPNKGPVPEASSVLLNLRPHKLRENSERNGPVDPQVFLLETGLVLQTFTGLTDQYL